MKTFATQLKRTMASAALLGAAVAFLGIIGCPQVTLPPPNGNGTNVNHPMNLNSRNANRNVNGGNRNVNSVPNANNANAPPPIADAGEDRIVAPGSEVVLEGCQSRAPSGRIVQWQWELTSGTPVSLVDSTTCRARFTAPDALAALSFRLTVWNDRGASASASVQVSVGYTLAALALETTRIVGGESTMAHITVAHSSESASDDTFGVFIEADPSTLVTVPAQVVMHGGQGEATFTIRTSRASVPTAVTLRASYAGSVRTTNITVLPQPDLASVAVEPPVLHPDAPNASVTVTLTGPATGDGAVIRLVTDRPDVVGIPNTIVIPRGMTSAVFHVSGSISQSFPFTLAVWGVNGDILAGSVFADVRHLAELLLCATSLTGSPQVHVTGLSEDVVTDGQWVCVYGDFPEDNYKLVLTGKKWIQPPLFSPNAEGAQLAEGQSEQIYCSCEDQVPLPVAYLGDCAASQDRQLCFQVPWDAPSGEYEIRVMDRHVDCSPGICPSHPCESRRLTMYVTPSFLTSVWETLWVDDDSEENGTASPAELAFAMTGAYGKPTMVPAQPFPTYLVASWPAGTVRTRSILAADDNTEFFPRVPLMVISECEVDVTECREECANTTGPCGGGSLPNTPSGVAECRGLCDNREAQGDYLNYFDLGMTAFEDDPGDETPWWLNPAERLAEAAACYACTQYAGPAGGLCCTASDTLIGDVLDHVLRGALTNDDDPLGSLSIHADRSSAQPGWAITTLFPPTMDPCIYPPGDQFEDERLKFEAVDISRNLSGCRVLVHNYRVGGPKITGWEVTIDSIRLVEGYESFNRFGHTCSSNGSNVNDIVIEARAALLTSASRSLPDPVAFPSTSSWKTMCPVTEECTGHPTVAYPGAGLRWSGSPFDFAPVLYLECAVWELDGDSEEPDQIGIYSNTFNVAALLSQGVDGIDASGHRVRTFSRQYLAPVHGWLNSDCDDCGRPRCDHPQPCPCGDPGWRGRAEITYTIKLVWQKDQ